MPVILYKTGVYCILNRVSGKRYVGSSARSLVNRWREHRYHLVRGSHCNRHLQAAWNKHGSDAFVFFVLERCHHSNCVAQEQYWINYYSSANDNFGYNLSPTAGNTLGVVCSDETKAKIASTKLGKRLSEEARRKMSAVRKGVKHSSKHQEAINNSLRSPEVRAKLSRGIKYSKTGQAKLKKLYG